MDPFQRFVILLLAAGMLSSCHTPPVDTGETVARKSTIKVSLPPEIVAVIRAQLRAATAVNEVPDSPGKWDIEPAPPFPPDPIQVASALPGVFAPPLSVPGTRASIPTFAFLHQPKNIGRLHQTKERPTATIARIEQPLGIYALLGVLLFGFAWSSWRLYRRRETPRPYVPLAATPISERTLSWTPDVREQEKIQEPRLVQPWRHLR